MPTKEWKIRIVSDAKTWEAINQDIAVEVKVDIMVRNGDAGQVICGWGLRHSDYVPILELRLSENPEHLLECMRRGVPEAFNQFINMYAATINGCMVELQDKLSKSSFVEVMNADGLHIQMQETKSQN